MVKFGRKVRCLFNGKIMCIRLDVGRRCIFEETSESDVKDGKLRFGYCPLLPEDKKLGFESTLLKYSGGKIERYWSD